LFVLALTTPAEAYIDTASSTLVWQFVLSACFGAAIHARRMIRAARSWSATRAEDESNAMAAPDCTGGEPQGECNAGTN
jgi:hypothetical protein